MRQSTARRLSAAIAELDALTAKDLEYLARDDSTTAAELRLLADAIERVARLTGMSLSEPT